MNKNFWELTIVSANDFTDAVVGTGTLYKAVGFNGDIVSDARSAAGVLQYGADSGTHVGIGWHGEMAYIAGEAISAGDRLTIGTSGYMTVAGSDELAVGRNGELSVSSGAEGRGVFGFESYGRVDASEQNFTTANDLSVAGADGKAVDMSGGDFAAAATAGGVLITTAASGNTATAKVSGITRVRAGDVVTAGRSITAAASGWFTNADSGDRVMGRALEASAAGNSGGLFRAHIHMLAFSAQDCNDIQY